MKKITIVFIFVLVRLLCVAQLTNTINCTDPCEGVTYPNETTQSVFDCTVSNKQRDSTFTFICIAGEKTPLDTTIIEQTISQGCFNPPDLVASSDTDNTAGTTTGWNTNYYSSDCPIYGDFEYCYDYDFSDFDNLFIVNLSSTKGSFWGQYSVYNYNRFATLNYLRPFQSGGGSYVTGWNNISPKTQTTVCIERVGNTITYSEDGNIFYTGVAFYLGPVYVNYTPYFHPTNTWSTGQHNLTNSKICETNGGENSRIQQLNNNRITTNNYVVLTPLEEFQTTPKFIGYQTGQFNWNDVQKQLNLLDLELSQKQVKELFKNQK